MIRDIRRAVDSRLKLPTPNAAAFSGGPHANESPSAFWTRVERAGRLLEALDLFDQLRREHLARAHTRRETKQEFWARMKSERRANDAKSALEELLATGLSEREVQEELVQRFQPLDGTETRAWQTPDPWEHGRLFRCRGEYARLQYAATYTRPDSKAEPKSRISWAELRRDERVALAAARRRARALRPAAVVSTTPAK
jgi:hypothetical protein